MTVKTYNEAIAYNEGAKDSYKEGVADGFKDGQWTMLERLAEDKVIDIGVILKYARELGL